MAATMVQRSPSPSTVRGDRSLFVVFLISIGVAYFLYSALEERRTADWTDGSRLDSVAMMTLEGIVMSFQTPQAVDMAVDAIVNEIRFADKHVLVTGGNRGLGKGIAAWALCAGAHVTVTSRQVSESVKDDVIAAAQNLSPCRDGISKNKISVVPLDLADLSTIDDAVEQLDADVDVAILNAGMTPEKMMLTKQNFEMALGVNAIGHYVLLNRLLESGKIPAGKDSRVIFVSSETHRVHPPLDFDQLFDSSIEFDYSKAVWMYGRSKLAVNTIANHFVRQLDHQNVSVHIICPGPVSTDIGRNAPFYVKPFVALTMSIFQSPEKAAKPVIMLAGAPEFGNNTGRYYHMWNDKQQRSDTTDPQRVEALVSRIENEIPNKYKKA